MRFSRIDLWQRFKIFGAFCSVLLTAACDGDLPTTDVEGPSNRNGTSGAASGTAYSIKGFWNHQGQRYRADFGPSQSSDSDHPNLGSAVAAHRLQSIGDCVGTDCSEIPLGTEADGEVQLFDAELLLMVVSDSCVRVGSGQAAPEGARVFDASLVGGIFNQLDSDLRIALDPASTPAERDEAIASLPRPWQPDTDYWYVFGNDYMPTCDHILARQEALLCTANRLTEIADAVTTVRYDTGNESAWEFPPQNTKDKFILRDLAMNALAHLGTLDLVNAGSGPLPAPFSTLNPKDCTNTYQLAIDNASAVIAGGTAAKEFVLGPGFSSWLTTTANTAPALIGQSLERAAYKTNILRAAGRLLRDIIDESVQGDLAGAERRRGSAGDPKLGLREMWGQEGVRYDSLAHALRVLFGRLEIGPPLEFTQWPAGRFDPQCGGGHAVSDGVRALDLIDAMGPGFSARWNSRPPVGPGQALAQSTIAASGVLVPPGNWDQATDIRAAVLEQLSRDSAASRGKSLSDFQTDEAAVKLLTDLVTGLTDEDLRFGVERAWDLYRLVTDSPESVTTLPAQAPTGLVFADGMDDELVSPTLAGALTGKVVQGGLSTRSLQIDPMGGLGRVQAASQCHMQINSTAFPIFDNDNYAWFVFQNAFSLGSSLMIRLAKMRDAMREVTVSTEAEKRNRLIDLSTQATAEMRTWAGEGQAWHGAEPAETTPKFRVIGLLPEEVGVEDYADMPGALAVVYGEPWEADCVAGTRTLCPEDVSSLELEILDSSAVPVSDPEYKAIGGADIYLTVSNPNHPITSPALSAKNYFIVAKNDLSGTGAGRVLASLTEGYFSSSAEVISNYQRDLASRVFGTGDPIQKTRTCSDVPNPALPPEYCIKGMQRDMFVPLANELTSTTGEFEDSWKHYLTLAQEAAARADELGRQLVDAGLQRDLRREGAQEEIGSLCGAFPAIDEVTIDDQGKVAGSAVDDQLNECLNPDTYDLVFLSGDPYQLPAGQTFKDANGFPLTVDQAIRSDFCPGRAGDPEFCKKTAEITHTGLGMKPYVPTQTADVCNKAVDAAAELKLLPLGDVALSANLFTRAREGGDKLKEVAGISHRATILGGLPPLDYYIGVWGPGNVPQFLDSNTGLPLWYLLRNGRPFIVPKHTVDSTGIDPTLEEATNIFPYCQTIAPTPVPTGHPVADFCDQEDEPSTGKEDCSSPCMGDARILERIYGRKAHEEPEALRLKIEAALWYAGALAGYIPGGQFAMPLPVWSGDCGAGSPCDDSGQPVEVSALYGKGGFYPSSAHPGSHYLVIDPDSDVENDPGISLALGAAYSHAGGDHADYWQLRADEGNRNPSWRSRLYSDASQNNYLTSWVYNSPALFDSLVAAPGGQYVPRDRIEEWIASFAQIVGDQISMNAACNDTATVYAGPLNQYTEFTDDAGLLEGVKADSIYASLPHPRNICPYGSYPVFYEDGVSGTGYPGLDNAPDIDDSTKGRLYMRANFGTQENIFEEDVVPLGPPTSSSSLYYGEDNNINGFSDNGLVTNRDFNFFGITGRSCKGTFGEPSRVYPSCFPYQRQGEHEECTEPPPRSNPCGGGVTKYLVGFALGAIPPVVDAVCGAARPPAAPFTPTCETKFDNIRGYSRRLLPSHCSPSQRAELFVNRYLRSDCELMEAVSQGLALSCLGSRKLTLNAAEIPPPIVTDLNSLKEYEAWLDSLEQIAGTALNGIVFNKVPKSLVDRFKDDAFTDRIGAGQMGGALLDAANQLQAIHSAWQAVGRSFRELASAVTTTRLQLESEDLREQERQIQLQRERLELSRQIAISQVDEMAGLMTAATALLPGGVSTGFPSGVSVSFSPQASAQALINGMAERDRAIITREMAQIGQQLLNQLNSVGAEQHANNQAGVLDSFGREVAHAFDGFQDAAAAIRTGSNSLLSALNTSESVQRDAQWSLAKAMSADFAEIDGVALPQPVNTVLNRQYNILRLRYGRALDQAKRAAYLARLSIEQRLGVRLADLDATLGPIEAPSTWVEELCSLQGIDYEALRRANPDLPSINEGLGAVTTNFANQFIGDYVARLAEFVEFYNFEFPFRQAEDTAVLSLRQHLLAPEQACEGESANLLYYSDQLYMAGQTGVDDASPRGWHWQPCTQGTCLTVTNGIGLRNPENPGDDIVDLDDGVPVEPPGGYGGVSWLRLSNKTGSAYPDGEVPPLAPPTENALFGTAYQTVDLKGGSTYVLSWWDMAREADGTPFGTSTMGEPGTYRVAVYDRNWNPIAAANFQTANSGPDGQEWSERRLLEVSPFADGPYHVAFQPSTGGGTASLAIANVQLEEPAQDLLNGRAYTRNEGTRVVPNQACRSIDAAQLRGMFTRVCEGGRADVEGNARTCFYELNQNILIDTELNNAGFGGLVGQVSRGNYNHRLDSLAVNLVGTGILDCAGDNNPSCFSSAFVEYDLEHLAYNAALIDYQGDAQCFNFGLGNVRSGKALTAERLISLPLSEADRGLIEQPAFLKTELFGRPVSGLYRLRIRDNAALVFDRLEDIQIVMNYRYWSRVTRPESE